LQNDKHIGKFLHIIRDAPGYPVFLDADRHVLSLPPIINSDLTKISLDTTDVFIDCTATDQTKLEVVINIMVSMFSMYCSEPFTYSLVVVDLMTASSQFKFTPSTTTAPDSVRTLPPVQ
jgi:phenylalanyl-tRNA synthetase beta chain